MIKSLTTAGLVLAVASFCYAQQSFELKPAPLEIIKDTKDILATNNIKIPIDNEAEAIRYSKALPIIKEYIEAYIIRFDAKKCGNSRFSAVFKKENNLWVVFVSPDHHCVIDSWMEVEFPPDCSYTNIYPGMGG